MTPRIETAMVLAAHGSSYHPEAQARVRALAAGFAGAGLFDEAVAAFVKDTPRLAEVLDQVEAVDVTVVPLFTSAGYFSQVVLPREMKLEGSVTRRDGRVIRLTDPVGEHPGIADLLLQRVEDLARRFALEDADTAVAVVGHGTRRNARSSKATLRHAETLRGSGPFRDVVTVFLDQPPEIETLFAQTLKRNVIVLPYLIGGAGHEREDVPARLGIQLDGDAWRQNPHDAGNRAVYFAPALGEDPALAGIVLDLARKAGAPIRPASLSREDKVEPANLNWEEGWEFNSLSVADPASAGPA